MLLKRICLITSFLVLLIGISHFMRSINIKYYQFFILIFFIFIFLLSLKKKYIITNLFLISLFTFQYGRIVLLPLLYNIKPNISWFHNYYFSNATLYFIYDLLFFNLIGIFICILIFNCKKFKLIRKNNYTNFITPIKKIIILVLIISFLFFLINNFIFLKELYTKGNYTDLFLTMTSVNSNILIKGIAAIFYPLLIILLAFYNDDKNIKNILFVLFIISNLIFSLKGIRAYFINSIFVVIYFHFKKINLKNIINILIVFSLLIFFSQFMLSFRSKDEYKNFSIKENIIGFIYTQGITGTYLGLLKDKPELFERKVPYIFSNIIGKTIDSQNNSDINVLAPGNIGLTYQLSARSNNEMYKKGFGMGGNYIIDMYDFLGKYGIIFLSFLHTYFSLYFFLDINNFNYYIRILLFIILDSYFLIPRTAYFSSYNYLRVFYVVVIYMGIYICSKILKRGSKNEKNFNRN